MTDFARSGYIPLDQAVEAVGRRLMPHQWLGQEINLLKLDSRALEEVEAVAEEATNIATPIGRLNRAVNYLIRVLFAGDVHAVLVSEAGDFHDLPSALWMRPGIRAAFGSGELPVSFRVAVEGHKVDARPRWVMVSEADVHRLLAPLVGGVEERDVESELRAWLEKKIAAHAERPPMRRRQTWMEAQGTFGSRLPYRSFERIWAATIPAAWRRQVRTRPAKPAQ
jgi:hypothetical protein